MKIAFTTLILTIFSISYSNAQLKENDIVGIWLTSGDDAAKVEISKSGDSYIGKIIWLKQPLFDSKPRMDKKNPNKDKRDQKVIGSTILSGFKFKDDEWVGGKIYDPSSGNTYSSYLNLKDKNTLKLRGYIGVSLLGRTEIWKRSKL